MKTSIVITSLISVLTFALAAIAQIAGFVSLSGIPIPALAGGLAASGVLAIAFSDYSRKPACRVRRVSRSVSQSAAATNRSLLATVADWTYTTRSA